MDIVKTTKKLGNEIEKGVEVVSNKVAETFDNLASHLPFANLAKKEDKVRTVPRPGGLLVDRIEFTGVADALEILYTANRFRPLARRALMILRPFLVFMRVRNPWVRLRGVLWG